MREQRKRIRFGSPSDRQSASQPEQPHPFHAKSLLSIPAEILGIILDELDARDLYTCMLVCKVLAAHIWNTTSLMYKMELAVAHVENGPPNNLCSADRLASLRELQRSWREPHFPRIWTVPCDSVFWSASCGVLALTSVWGSLQLYQVPSQLLGVPEKQWHIENSDTEMLVVMFEFDLTQDLVVFVQANDGMYQCLHPRSLSKPSEKHPLAATPHLVPFDFYFDDCPCCLYVQGDTIGWLVYDHEERVSSFQLWNWKTGRQILHIVTRENEAPCTTFMFLDHRRVLVTRLDQLEVYAFDADAADSHVEPSRICTFKLPEAARDAEYLRSSFLAQNHSNVQPSPDRHPAFRTPEKHELFMVYTLLCKRHAHVGTGFVFMVAAPVILCRIEHAYPGQCFAWDDWGSLDTRVIELPEGHVDTFVDVRGTKAVLAYMIDGDITQLQVKVLETNLDIIRQELRNDECGSAVYETEPCVLSASDFFKNHLISTLWCRRSETRVNTPLTSYQADERGAFMDCLLMEDGILFITTGHSVQFFAF